MEKPIDFCTTVDEQSNREVASLWKDDLVALMHGREEHNELIRVCSPIVTEEDGSDLIPNWARVQNALMRIIADRDSYKAGLADLYSVACNGMIGDDALCMVNAEKLLEL